MKNKAFENITNHYFYVILICIMSNLYGMMVFASDLSLIIYERGLGTVTMATDRTR